MVGAQQNLNGLHDLTTSLSGIVCHSWASIAMINRSAKFEVYLYPL